MNLGLFGGTFDPPHIGHLIVAQDAAEALALERVLFLPAGEPPHKRRAPLTPAPLRVEMTRLATRDVPGFEVDDRETRRAGPSWTVDTLAELRRERPDDALVLLVGADQYAVFDTWRDVRRIRSLCRVAVLDREGENVQVQGDDVRVRVTRIDISASDIRARVEACRPIRHHVPAAVEAFIREHALYGVAEAGVRPSGAIRNEIPGPG